MEQSCMCIERFNFESSGSKHFMNGPIVRKLSLERNREANTDDH